nr:MAG TPA: hypothetical protein [Caudoviricetes sp.]
MLSLSANSFWVSSLSLRNSFNRSPKIDKYITPFLYIITEREESQLDFR